MTIQELEKIEEEYIEENGLSILPDYVLEHIKKAIGFGYRTAQHDIFVKIQEPLSMLP